MKKVYIAGKVSGIEEKAVELFENAEQLLIKKGFEVVNPMKLPHNHDKTWESYMKESLTEMMKCQYIHPLPNHTESVGATIEVNLAKELGITCILINEIENK
jgi:hypothetical protein